jgi:hypothetical protein
MNFFLEILYVVLYRYLFFFRIWLFPAPGAGGIFYADDFIMSIIKH